MQYNNTMLKTIFILFLILSADVCAIEDSYCFDDAAKRTGMNKDILLAIAMVESSLKRNATNRNKDGSEDIGVMQINSTHFDLLKSAGVERKDLFNACVNIHVGALILRDCIRRRGNNWDAIGAYNAGYSKKNASARKLYANKVWLKYKKLKGLA